MFVQQHSEEGAKTRDIYMSVAREPRGQRMSRDSSSSIHPDIHDPPPPHAPAVPIRSPPASPGTEAHASLGGAREWLPPRWESLSPWPLGPSGYPSEAPQLRPAPELFFPSCWLGRRRSKGEPLRSSHLRLATRRATLRSEADKHFFFFFFLSLLFQPRLSRPFISAALSSPFLLGKRRCISTSRPPPSHDIAVQPVLNSGHHVVINTPDRDDARRAPERGLQVAHLLGHLEKVWHILCAPLFDARPPRSVLLRWHKRCYYIDCRHAKSAVKPSGGFGVSTQSAASTNERVDVLCKLALIGCEHLDSASENMC